MEEDKKWKSIEEYKASLIYDLKQEIKYLNYSGGVAVLDVAGKQIVGMLKIFIWYDKSD